MYDKTGSANRKRTHKNRSHNDGGLQKSKLQGVKSRILEFEDNLLAAQVFGQHDKHLSRIEVKIGVTLINRGNRIAIEGEPDQVSLAVDVLQDLYHMVKTGVALETGDVDGVIRMLEGEPVKRFKRRRDASNGDGAQQSVPSGPAIAITTRNKVVTARSKGQADYIKNLMGTELVFGVGPAGTGKTYLAVANAVSRMLSGAVDRIILSRPAVEAGESLGFLPGDLKEKIDPYLRPLYDALYDMMPPDQVEKRLISGQIEIAPLAYMRGRTLSNACIILDEAQNTTPMQMKMFLTRFGENSHMVVCGDPSQIDLPGGTKSGLNHALDILEGIEGVAVTRFSHKDVVRHALVARIVDAYESSKEK